jgi:DNA-binding Xre family transcriptional regulator
MNLRSRNVSFMSCTINDICSMLNSEPGILVKYTQKVNGKIKLMVER